MSAQYLKYISLTLGLMTSENVCALPASENTIDHFMRSTPSRDRLLGDEISQVPSEIVWIFETFGKKVDLGIPPEAKVAEGPAFAITFSIHY